MQNKQNRFDLVEAQRADVKLPPRRLVAMLRSALLCASGASGQRTRNAFGLLETSHPGRCGQGVRTVQLQEARRKRGFKSPAEQYARSDEWKRANLTVMFGSRSRVSWSG